MKTHLFILQLCKRFKFFIFGQFIVALIFAFWCSYWPYLEKCLIEILSTAPKNELVQAITPTFCLYIGLGLATGFIFRFYDWLFIHYEPLFKQQIRHQLSAYLWKHSHRFFQGEMAGSLVNKVMDVSDKTHDVLKMFIEVYLFTVIYFIWLGFVLYNIKPLLSLGVLAWTLIFVYVAYYYSKKGQPLAMFASEKRSFMVGKMVDSVSNVSSIRFFAAHKLESFYLLSIFKELMYAARKRDWVFFQLNLMQTFLFNILQVLSYGYLVYCYQKNEITLGDFVMMFGVMGNLFMTLWNLSKQISDFNESIGVIRKGLEIIQKPHEIVDKPNAKALIFKEGKIEFRNVDFHYEENTAEPFFSNKTIIIEGGQKVGLVGYSGSGKTTFVNLILRMFDVQSGNITIDNQDIQDISLDSLYKTIGYIPQEPSLFDRSIKENIAYGFATATMEDIIAAAKGAHADEFIERFSEKYDTIVGERGAKLSGGQRQRIAIARAFLKNAPILILDEATSALDTITERLIQDSLWQLMQHKTTLVIAHRLSTLLHMDRILVFDQGKIVQDGAHQELSNQPGLYKTLWEAQIGGIIPD